MNEVAVKRVNAAGEMQSATLRSDTVARYLFMGETLLEGVGLVAARAESTGGPMGPHGTSVGAEGAVEDKTLSGLLDALRSEAAQNASKPSVQAGGSTGGPGETYDAILAALEAPDAPLDDLEAQWRAVSGCNFVESVPAVPATVESGAGVVGTDELLHQTTHL